MKPTAKFCARSQPVLRPNVWIPCMSLTSAVPSAKMVSDGCKTGRRPLLERSMLFCSAVKK